MVSTMNYRLTEILLLADKHIMLFRERICAINVHQIDVTSAPLCFRLSSQYYLQKSKWLLLPMVVTYSTR